MGLQALGSSANRCRRCRASGGLEGSGGPGDGGGPERWLRDLLGRPQLAAQGAEGKRHVNNGKHYWESGELCDFLCLGEICGPGFRGLLKENALF